MYKLLIVDDEPIILKGMQKILDWESYCFSEIVSAGSYQEALEQAIILQPDLCLCDVCIHEQKGYDLINRLYELGVRSNYIMMSGYSEFAYAQEAIRCDAVDYLLKPVETKKLQEAVEKVILTKLGGSIEGFQEETGVDPVLKRPYDEISSLVTKILRFVDAEYANDLNLKLLGEKFHMNSAYLGQLFLQETEMKFSEYLMKFRLHKAYTRIRVTNDKVAVIAASVGYDNMSYFYTHFKACFGMSPTEIRDQNGV